MSVLNRLLAGLRGLAVRLVWLSGALLIIAAAIVAIDVTVRKLFNLSLGGADEITGYAFGISIMLSLPYALLHRSNIRIDVVYQHLGSRLRAVLDVLGMILLTGFIGYVAWRGWFLLLDTYANGSRSITPLRTPLGIPQTAWLAGLILAVLTGLALIAAGISGLVRQEWQAVGRLLGIPTVEEQIEDEI